MRIEKIGMWMFGVNAVINWTLSLRGIIDPVGYAVAFGGPEPNYPFVLRLWMGLVFMFGIMFWETSRDVRRKAALVKYNWIEKTITAGAVTLGFFAGEVPERLMLLIVFTNWLWIPPLVWFDRTLRRSQQSAPFRGEDGMGVSWG
ncbi:MAG: hypothetical protein Q8R92_02040 [Deltaproteobacteria bacterium]|nr:hypothetical protein [Deltaproteobacteria bacterium]